MQAAAENAAGIPLHWARTAQPTIASLFQIQHLLPAAKRAQILSTDHEPTSYERNDCRGMPAHLHAAATSSIAAAARLFQQEVQPAAQATGTRASYARLWRCYVTFAIAHDAVDHILPASLELMQAFMWSLLRNGLRPGTISLHVQAIVDKHAKTGTPFPVPTKEVRNWTRALQRLCAVPTEEGPALTKAQLHAVLRLPRRTIRDVRDATIIAIGVICASRPSELADLDVCDILFDHDAPGTTVVRVKKRKNDQQRSGLWPRIGSSRHRALDVTGLIREWMHLSKATVHEACEKQRYPRSSCRACGRLFTRIQTNGRGCESRAHEAHGITKATITSAVRNSLRRIGEVDNGYSGTSLRRGGLSTALFGGVPSELYELQSGHRSAAWKRYVRNDKQSEFLRFFQAFDL